MRMAKILHIIGNPKKVNSYSRRLADQFLESYKEKNPDDEVETLDLAETPIPHLDDVDVAAIFTEEPNDKEKEKQEYNFKLIDQFLSADKIIITAPMWNFNIPSVLKAYIDHIIIAGKTFKFGEKGPEGLAIGKKTIFIGARGGVYSEGPAKQMEFHTSYLKTIFGFIGLKDSSELIVEGTNMKDLAEGNMTKALEEAKTMAELF